MSEINVKDFARTGALNLALTGSPFREGMQIGDLNDGATKIMAALYRLYKDAFGVLAATGTTGTWTITPNVTGLSAPEDGFWTQIKPSVDCLADQMLRITASGAAKPVMILKRSGLSNVAAADLVHDRIYRVTYNASAGTDGAWVASGILADLESDLPADSVGTSQLVDASITLPKLAAGVIPSVYNPGSSIASNDTAFTTGFYFSPTSAGAPSAFAAAGGDGFLEVWATADGLNAVQYYHPRPGSFGSGHIIHPSSSPGAYVEGVTRWRRTGSRVGADDVNPITWTAWIPDKGVVETEELFARGSVLGHCLTWTHNLGKGFESLNLFVRKKVAASGYVIDDEISINLSGDAVLTSGRLSYFGFSLLSNLENDIEFVQVRDLVRIPENDPSLTSSSSVEVSAQDFLIVRGFY